MPALTPDAPGAPGPPRTLLGTAVQRVVGLVALLVALGVLVAPRMSMNRYDVVAAAVGVVVVVVAWAAACLALRGRRGRDGWWDVAAAVLCLLLAVVAGVCAYAGGYATTWDPSTIEYASGLPPG